MCGRFTRGDDKETLITRFGLKLGGPELLPRYNIAPGQDAAVILQEDDGRVLKLMHWGLVPHWAQDAKIGFRMINARAESLDRKPAYKSAFKRRRCLIPADGFYEWIKPAAKGRPKQPLRFTLRDGAVFSFAGIWESWTKPDGAKLESFSIITTTANELVAKIHERMPVILPPRAEAAWLETGPEESAGLLELLAPYPAQKMRSYPVSSRVNSVRNEGPDLIEPQAMQADLFGLE